MIVPKLDLHAHVVPAHSYPTFLNGQVPPLTVEQLRKMYDVIGVEKGVALPLASPEHMSDQMTNRDAWQCSTQNPETIGWWFMNIDPRWLTNSAEANLSVIMRHYQSLGAKGIGELTSNLPIESPLMQNLFHHAAQCQLPILFHLGELGQGYGIVDDLGLPQLEKSLQAFPILIFIGHSHRWWSEISGDCTQEIRGTRPQGKVVPGGRLIELMRRYPNMHADLSAGSGQNAIMRDEAFGYHFLEEFQDQIYFGVDYCMPENYFELSHYLDRAVTNGKISQQAYTKICRGNLLKLVQ